MIFTDTHTHPYYVEEINEQNQQIQRCLDAGISRLFLPCVDGKSLVLMQHLVSHYPNNCFPMLGLHPCNVKESYRTDIQYIQSNPFNYQPCAIGEIGMDLYWDKTFVKEQEHCFRVQIEWANSLQLPIVIHCRNAFEEVMNILKEYKNTLPKGIFHCFSGSIEQANRAIDMGFYLGIGGVLTYKNAKLDKVVEQIDIQHIVLETDAPYLTPVPFRGQANESAYLVYVAQKLAEVKQMSLEDVAKITTQNSVQLFGF